MKKLNQVILLVCFLSFFLLACSRIPSALPATPVAKPPSQSETAFPPSPYPYPGPGDSNTPPPQPDGEETILLPIISGPSPTLPAQGPWLLFLENERLSILSLTEGSRIPVAAEKYAGPPSLETAVSPTGQHVAFLTAADNRFHNLTLRVVSLPKISTIQTISLTSAETEPGAEAGPGETGFEIARTIASLDNLAWSPDGLKLAFTGAQTGPSADLYLLDVDTGQLTRLTDESSQATRPRWSPEGSAILYSGLNSLGTGAGFGMTGVWAVSLDGSDPVPLDMPKNSGDERHLGWAGPDTAIRYTFNPRCGTHNLRAINIRTGQVRIFWTDAFQAVGFDPVSAKVLVSVASLDETCNPSGTQGLILTHPEAQDALLVSDKNALEITWSPEAGQFLVATPEGVVAFDLFGRQTILPGAFDRLPTFAPSGNRYVWTQTDFQGIPGIWLGEIETVPTQFYNGKAALPLWNTVNNELVFFDNKGVYKTDFETPPVLIAAGFSATDAVIIQPK